MSGMNDSDFVVSRRTQCEYGALFTDYQRKRKPRCHGKKIEGSIYCQPCLDRAWQRVKTALAPDLWAGLITHDDDEGA